MRVSQVYCANGKTYLHHPSSGWTVRKIFASGDKLTYVELVNKGDPTLTKAVSLNALTDPRLFQLTA